MSQNFDLRSEDNERQPLATAPSPTPLPSSSTTTQWVPQPSTNQFAAPRVYEYRPHQGNEQDTLQIGMQFSNPEYVSFLRIALGSCVLPTRTFLVNPSSDFVSLTASVPSWQLTQTADGSRVPVYVLVLQHSVVDSWFVDYFHYGNPRKRTTDYQDDYDLIHKRPRSVVSPGEESESPSAAAAAAAAAAYMVPAYSGYSSYYGLPQSPYMGLQPQAAQTSPGSSASATGVGSRFDDTATQSSQLISGYSYRQPPASSSTLGAPLSFTDSEFATSMGGNTLSPSAGYMMPPSSIPTQSSPATTPLEHITPTGGGTGATAGAGPSHGPTSATPAPGPVPLAEGPTAPPPPPPLASAATAPAGYDPFAKLLHKANLRVEGNLDDLVNNWTDEEVACQRRLVQFWRRQEGNEVTCSFASVQLPADRRQLQSNMIVVSCIYWRDKDEYFVTSVDCIYLLESLIGVRFTVEEKNRIRRNLEGFRPLTVSKLKPESVDFFKLIMGFPNPKPRNIEKDVKVFPWNILGVALKKIISKYTASYSSTASVNLDAFEESQQQQPPSDAQPSQSSATIAIPAITATSSSSHSSPPPRSPQPTQPLQYPGRPQLEAPTSEND